MAGYTIYMKNALGQVVRELEVEANDWEEAWEGWYDKTTAQDMALIRSMEIECTSPDEGTRSKPGMKESTR